MGLFNKTLSSSEEKKAKRILRNRRDSCVITDKHCKFCGHDRAWMSKENVPIKCSRCNNYLSEL